VVDGPVTDREGALDVNGGFTVSGALVVAAGSAGMAEAPDNGEGQATLDVLFNSSQAAGTVVQVRSQDGTVIATFQSTKSFQSLVISSPELVAGQTYDVYTGGTVSGESLGGLHPDAGATGTLLGSITAI
jgi:hypothetical protein